MGSLGPAGRGIPESLLFIVGHPLSHTLSPAMHNGVIARLGLPLKYVAVDIPPAEAEGDGSGLLVLGLGSTYGAITGAVRRARADGRKVAHLHLRHLNPLPHNTGEVLARYRKVLVPEMNLGQLAFLLRGRYLVDAISYSKVQGKPFKVSEIVTKIDEVLR